MLPRSLFGRHALLIAALLLLAQVASVVLLHRLVYLPRVEHGAALVARQLDGVRQGLLALPPAGRDAFIARYNQAAGGLAAGHVAGPDSLAAGPVDRLALLDRGFLRALAQRLHEHGIDAVWRPARADGLALRLRLDGAEHWILMPEVVPGRAFTGALIAMLAGSTLAALAAALWLQRWLNRPLARLVAAARTLAAERPPDVLPEDGPVEIATVSRSFNRLVGSLSLAERERALMLAGISHDLRTPLTKLRLGVEILRGCRIEPALLGGMARSIEEMDDTIGQFLDFARAEAERTPPVPLALDALAREAAAACADHQRPLQLQLQPLPALPLRPQAMRRVLDNLLENAWRHGRPPVSLRTAPCPGGVCLEVRDHGPGIAPDEVARLCQPFVRGLSVRGGVPGAGLGLAIAERIVRQHGGRLQLLPADGGGLLARVLLPLPVPAASPSSPASPSATPPSGASTPAQR